MAKIEKIRPERRSHPRIRKLNLVSFINKMEGRQVSPVSMGRTLDISPAGVRVEVCQEIEIDSIMEMEISIHPENTFVQGKVVRTKEVDEKTYIIGIQFDEIQEDLDYHGEQPDK